eukprot:3583882-Alexandrium_andersonii.AAC.1
MVGEMLSKQTELLEAMKGGQDALVARVEESELREQARPIREEAQGRQRSSDKAEIRAMGERLGSFRKPLEDRLDRPVAERPGAGPAPPDAS